MKIDLQETKRFESILRDLNRRGIPFATKYAIDTAAINTSKIAKKTLPGKMVLRNTWSKKSIQYTKAHTSNLRAFVGSVAPHMKTQELGATRIATGKYGVSIPTSTASGEGRGAAPRKKPVQPVNYVRNITIAKRPNSGVSRRQRNRLAVKMAAQKGKKYIFMDLGKTRGIFRISGGEDHTTVDMVHSLANRTVTTPPNPWLRGPSDSQRRRVPVYYIEGLKRQLARLGL